jgi:uncharacterized protein (TIGR00159 family)
MKELLSPFLEVGLADVVDIVVVTGLVSAVLGLIRRTQAGFVAIGILIVGALYIVARALDLQLTAWIFQGFFAVFLIMIVVVFQEELRQLFERIAMWGLRRRDATEQATDPTDVILSCVADFARDRVGALIVIPGTQPILRHIQGGVELDGKLSKPLLMSIFDKHSPGHDGAVIIANGRITHFAAHLPLSKEPEGRAYGGTRHSAATGLTERTDALCLVVSEERGTISACRNGHLRVLRSPHEAGVAVDRFLKEKHPAPERGALWTQLVRENALEKAIALGLVIALWYLFVPGARRVQFTYAVPVTVDNLPAGFELESVEPSAVEVTFSGLRRAFYLFEPARLEVTVDASLARLGRRTFQLSATDLVYPKDLTLQDLEPSQVRISLRKAAAGDGEGHDEGQNDRKAPDGS